MAWEKLVEDEGQMVVGAVWRSDGEPGFGVTVRHRLQPETEPEYAEHRTIADAIRQMRLLLAKRDAEAIEWVTVAVRKRDGQRQYVLWNWTEDLCGKGYAVVKGQFSTKEDALRAWRS